MNFSAKYIAAIGAVAFSLCIVSVAHADTTSQDKKFVEDSGKGSLAEIEMAKLALKNSANKEVLGFASKMIHDHTMLIQSMAPFAQKMGVPPPTKMARSEQDEYDRLARKKGASFDKDYITTMVDDHHKDLMDFTKEAETTENSDLKATVLKGRDVISQHNMMIDGIAHEYNIAVPVQK